ncbi:MAG: hypothetical protein EBY29_03325 [Planctomycetes bacterium]|nr:hypothetical protein [Planctomycetota bacterium]
MAKSVYDEWLANHKDEYISGYRADPKGKFGGKTGLETQPKYFNKAEIANYLKGMATARDKFGLRHPDPETLTNLLLKEGRNDFGANHDFPGSPEGYKRYLQMTKALKDDPSVGNLSMAATMDEHMRRADERKRPFPHVWNGGGKQAAQYNKDFEAAKYAATHPQNLSLYNFVKQHLGLPIEKPTPSMQPKQPPISSDIPEDVPVELPDDYRKGGRVRMI